MQEEINKYIKISAFSITNNLTKIEEKFLHYIIYKNIQEIKKDTFFLFIIQINNELIKKIKSIKLKSKKDYKKITDEKIELITKKRDFQELTTTTKLIKREFKELSFKKDTFINIIRHFKRLKIIKKQNNKLIINELLIKEILKNTEN